ncbi:hypothetical protein FFONT_1063 [Fervidicoccus fontis Kam940]|uniref:Uncharacterized protein n=1 Tax=Fervidicoccus fontis (strain DSM 19380 / JCM 18336 / VKM B-2539 / Kam940) TaxID=1163730 RepID=I0A244_FERFK|nr:hypothetical protein FFONT_1063 [Fervidicoccus fontis Kam940]
MNEALLNFKSFYIDNSKIDFLSLLYKLFAILHHLLWNFLKFLDIALNIPEGSM